MTAEKEKVDPATAALLGYVKGRADDGDPQAQFALAQYRKGHPETPPEEAKPVEVEHYAKK